MITSLGYFVISQSEYDMNQNYILLFSDISNDVIFGWINPFEYNTYKMSNQYVSFYRIQIHI